MSRVVAVLGVGTGVQLVTADAPILRADDVGILRGDGIFESVHLRGDKAGALAWLLDEHLARLAISASLTDLELPEHAALVELVEKVLAAWPAGEEGRLRIVCTRGPEDGGGPPTVFAIATPMDPELLRLRRDGVRVRTASLGLPADMRRLAPWLLGGAKTTSYAVNVASQRWAKSVGADDVLWVSAEGYALEAPTSTLVWLADSTLSTVPAADTGILAGTTARWLLDHAEALGRKSAPSMITPTQLLGCDGAWLVSAVRGLVAIRVLDGAPMSYSSSLTRQISDLLGYGIDRT